LNNIYNKLNMNLDVHLMVVLIIFYQIIQLFQMGKENWSKFHAEYDALRHAKYVYFNHKHIWNNFYQNIYIANYYYYFKILGYISFSFF
jgi:pentose-5-phosphate-3-epimerase